MSSREKSSRFSVRLTACILVALAIAALLAWERKSSSGPPRSDGRSVLTVPASKPPAPSTSSAPGPGFAVFHKPHDGELIPARASSPDNYRRIDAQK